MTMHAQRCLPACCLALALMHLPAAALAVEFGLNMNPVSSTSVAGFRMHYDDDAVGAPFDGDFAAEGPSPVEYPIDTLEASAPRLTLNVPTCTHLYLGISVYDLEGSESTVTPLDGTVVGSPQDVVVKPGGQGKLIVRWSGLSPDDTGALAGYRIHYDTDGEAPYEGTGADQGDSPIEVGADTTYFELTRLTVGDTMHLVVEAYCPDTKKQQAAAVSAEVVETVEPECNNWILEVDEGETCDPVETCPTADECEDDDDACTVATFVGSAAECTAKCTQEVISSCANGDGCCPAGCNPSNDDDCSAECGNEHVDEDETCDPPGSCPADCNDRDACTVDSMTGSADNCNVKCNNYLNTSCVHSDGCCPLGCTSASDDDCKSTEPTPTGSTDSSTSSPSLGGGGCNVATQASPAWLFGLALLGLAALRRRRR